MHRPLELHPQSQCTAVTGIEVEATRPRPASLALLYRVSGSVNDLRLPALAATGRTDDLWRHTCFEAFIRGSNDAFYYEFNFSPSTQWAAYRFDGYRGGMEQTSGIGAPQIGTRTTGTGLELDVLLELDGLADLASDALWRVGLSAVIEETSGRKSYWALARPPGNTDFHHSHCFALELPRA